MSTHKYGHLYMTKYILGYIPKYIFGHNTDKKRTIKAIVIIIKILS